MFKFENFLLKIAMQLKIVCKMSSETSNRHFDITWY